MTTIKEKDETTAINDSLRRVNTMLIKISDETVEIVLMRNKRAACLTPNS